MIDVDTSELVRHGFKLVMGWRRTWRLGSVEYTDQEAARYCDETDAMMEQVHERTRIGDNQRTLG